MCSSVAAAVLSLSILVLSEGLNKEAEKEFASGLLHVLDMEHAPNISSRRHDIPRYVLNLYRGKFTRKSPDFGGRASLGSSTRIFFPQDLDEAASSVVLRFNLSLGGLNGTHTVRKAELRLLVHPGDGGIVQVSIVRLSRSLNSRDIAVEDQAIIASQECHKMIKSRWLVFNLTRDLHSEVRERKENLQLVISTTPPLRIALKRKRQPFLVVLTEPMEPPRELHRFLPLMRRQYATGRSRVNGKFGVTPMEESTKRSKRSGISICHKRRLAVRFRDLKWNGWIIAPTRFGFHYCDGHCPGTLNQEANPSNHAILQNILHHRLSKKIPAATCVPTELHSMSLLYYDTDDTIVLREVPGMVASNCGCR